MLNRIAEIVHIIPLGHEVDRAVKPFENAPANRVYLVVDRGDVNGTFTDAQKLMDAKQKKYTYLVKKELEKKNIKVNIVPTNTFDLEELLRTLTSLIKLEKKRGCDIYMNMSGSGRLAAVGASIAGMAYDVNTYYVHADRFSDDNEKEKRGLSICDNANETILPVFKFDVPGDTDSMVLKCLYDANKTGIKDGYTLSKTLIDYLLERNAEGFEKKEGDDEKDKRDIESRHFMKLANIMRRLLDAGYVESKKDGRKIIYKITTLGEHALSLCGPDLEKFEEMF